MFSSAKVIPATVSFVDIAGIVRGASEGQGLGNKFLANIRESDAICQVIRAFTDSDVVHVEGRVSPKDDIETINTELILADLQTLEKAIPRLEKESRKDKDKAALLGAAVSAQAILDEGRTLYSAGIDLEPLRELSLLTTKPFLTCSTWTRKSWPTSRRSPSCGRSSRRPRRSSWTPRSRPSSPSCPRRKLPSCWPPSGRTSRACTSWRGSASRLSVCRPT